MSPELIDVLTPVNCKVTDPSNINYVKARCAIEQHAATIMRGNAARGKRILVSFKTQVRDALGGFEHKGKVVFADQTEAKW